MSMIIASLLALGPAATPPSPHADAYFEVAGASDSGLPAAWIETAKDYLREIDQQRDTWCA